MSIDFSHLFNVFSRRDQPRGEHKAQLTPEFRYRVLQLCEDTFGADRHIAIGGSVATFWLEIEKKLQYFHGRLNLMNRPKSDRDCEAIAFLSQCSDEHFLDFVEMTFQSDCFRNSNASQVGMVGNINKFLEQDNLPYSLTEFVHEEVPGPASLPHLQAMTSTRIAAYPRIIRRESEVLHRTAIAPALSLLQNPVFASAHQEFLDALTDYRKGDYGDCITKCGSSFESTLKIICKRKGWPYKENDTASALITTIMQKTSLDSFFKEPLTLIATMRNRLSTAHGAGSQPRTAPKHVARYAINTTASAILLFVDETGV